MRVLQFVTRLDLGGAQEVCLAQCRRLIEAGHEVHLLTGPGGERMGEARRIRGLVLHVWPDWRREIRPLADLRCLWRLASWLAREPFDVLHTHSSKAGFVGRLAAWIARKPSRVVHQVHGWSFNRSQAAPVRRLCQLAERLVARPGFALVSCSRETARQGLAAGIGRAQDHAVIYCGVERRPFSKRWPRAAVRRRLRAGARDVVFLLVGNLKAQKDPLAFVAAAARVAARLRRARFWIVGDGPLRARVVRAARRYGLGTRLKLLGWRQDVPQLVAAADVVVLPSRFEGLPLALLQAMAAAKPVVATAVDGTPEAVADGWNGRLVPAGDIEALAEAMAALGRAPALRRRMGRRGSEWSRRFDRERALREVFRLYSREGGDPSTSGASLVAEMRGAHVRSAC